MYGAPSRSYALVVADISYFEAWGMWLDGRSTLGSDLFGMPMIWWGRGGKIAAFVSGFTVVLDILGPDKLREFADRVRRVDPKRARDVERNSMVGLATFSVGTVVTGLLLVGLVALQLAIVLAVLLVAATYSRAALGRVIWKIADLIEDPRPARWWRFLSFLVFIVGFHFDLLAS